MFHLSMTPLRRLLTAAVVLGALVPAVAQAQAPDVPYATPVGRTAQASGSISKSGLQSLLAREMRKAPGASGAWVYDTKNSEVVFSRRSTRRRIPASNMKLFTTATAYGRYGTNGNLETQIWRTGSLTGSKLRGSLFLVGGGDPALASRTFAKRFTHGVVSPLGAIAAKIKNAGIRRVTGKLYYDDTFFDRRRGVQDSGGRTSPYIGPLSGLDYNSGYKSDSGRGFASDPARVAALKLIKTLHSRGVRITSRTTRKGLPGAASSRVQIGRLQSPSMHRLIRETLVYSNNHWAEQLLKALGGTFRGSGTTRTGTRVVRSFMENQLNVSGFDQVDGSGLSRPNRIAPAAMGTMLRKMMSQPDAGDWQGTLARAGHQGTLRRRMRGTAAADHCRAKTGTLHDVSALSGYCFNGNGRVMIFSILQNNVGNMSAAKAIEDRMAVGIARY
jgi:D-alanyl-D-alanine carboxypeptidase/D-alanyl-D-alanine-endopeptidase (penicillin-binding protein 4)